MDVLAVVRRMSEKPPSAGCDSWETPICGWCGDGVYDESTDPHEPDCPWLALPAIVAALENEARLRQLMALYDMDKNWMHGEWMGPGGAGDVARYALGLPIEDWAETNIRAALSAGDGATKDGGEG